MGYTLRPHAPDGADEIAFERADGRALGLARAHATRAVVLRRGPPAQLGQGDAVEDRVEPPVAAAVEAVTDPPSRGRLHRGDAGIGGEWGRALEAAAGTPDPGEGAGGEQLVASLRPPLATFAPVCYNSSWS